jgi:hypothetical protein
MVIVLKSGNLNLLEACGPVQACNEIAFTATIPGHNFYMCAVCKGLVVVVFST